MAEIILGLIAIAAALAVALGLTDGVSPVPLGRGVIVTAAVLASTLILRGAYRLKRRASGNSPALRSLGLAGTVAGLTIVTALAIPALSETLNVAAVGGFPLGLYMMAQGVLILFVVVLFAYAAWQNRIDGKGDSP